MRILLIGAGKTGTEYLKALRETGRCEVDVLARSGRNSVSCLELGARAFLTWESRVQWDSYDRVIVCVPIENSVETLAAAIQRTDAPILFEKPGFLNSRELERFFDEYSNAVSRS